MYCNICCYISLYFLRYKNALNSRLKVQLFCEQKDHEGAINVLKTVFEEFKSAVCDKHIV